MTKKTLRLVCPLWLIALCAASHASAAPKIQFD